jgi:hypothetical protein
MLSKMKTSVVVAALMMAVSAYAKDTNAAAPAKLNIAAIQASLSELPAVEIPVKASEMMKAASKEAKLETAKAILKSVLEQRPQMAIQLVASLVKASPESASQISTLALAIVPQYGDSIIRAAAVSAPQYAGEIAAAAITTFPALQADIVNWVSLAVPSQSSNIASAVEKRTTQDSYIRMVTEALAQANSQGNIQSLGTTLQKILTGSPTLQAQLVQGIQQQVNQRLEAEKNEALKNIADGGSGDVEIVTKEVSIEVIGGFVVIKEKVTSRKTVTVQKTGSTFTTTNIVDTPEEGDGQEVAIVEVTPTDFPDVTDVEAKVGEAGTDESGRIEQQAFEDLLEAQYNL